MRLGAVVLHYRYWPQIGSTLEALLTQTMPPDDVIVVDNQSGDGSVAELRRAFPRIEVIETHANLGYAGGMNAGAEQLLRRGVDAILLLTHECHLATNALEVMAARLESESSVGAVGPLLGYRSRPEMVFSAGGIIDRRWRPQLVREPQLVADWTGRQPRAVEWLHGSCLLLRASAIRDAGKMDEHYFLYFEETEYLLKLRRLGWVLECVPGAMAWQEPGVQPTYLWVRNRLRFLGRTAPSRHVLREASRLVASIAKNSVFPDPRATPAQLRDRRRALVDFLARRWGPDESGSPDTDKGRQASHRARGVRGVEGHD